MNRNESLPNHPIDGGRDVTETVSVVIEDGVALVADESRAFESIVLGTSHFQEANAMVRAALERTDTVDLKEVFAQRYLGCAMGEGKRLNIFGTPGNDLACYLDGGAVKVFGNAQDQIGNTMNAGSIVVHGRCGDAAGYAMRGGKIIVRDGCGWRSGINMKQYEDKCPAIVIGKDAGSFLGEYMAGGVILIMGKPGEHMASGMHGGVIYLRRAFAPAKTPEGLALEEPTLEDMAVIDGLLGEYNDAFAAELGAPVDRDALDFVALRPASSRPYAAMYAS